MEPVGEEETAGEEEPAGEEERLLLLPSKPREGHFVVIVLYFS